MPNYALLVSLFLRTGKAQSGVEAQLHTKGEANYIPKWKPIIYQSGSQLYTKVEANYIPKWKPQVGPGMYLPKPDRVFIHVCEPFHTNLRVSR